jgi:hypothetical protein
MNCEHNTTRCKFLYGTGAIYRVNQSSYIGVEASIIYIYIISSYVKINWLIDRRIVTSSTNYARYYQQ